MYSHRDASEARRATTLVLDHVPLDPGALVLDVACGAGRHVGEFQRAGYRAVGLDLSFVLLERARRHGRAVVRGDMRHLPFASDRFALTTNFFTSFGYFPEPEEDARVLAEIGRVLAHGGFFALDFLNADRVRAELRERDERTIRGRRVVQTRSLVEEGAIIQKRIEIHDPADRLPHTFFERVRLYGPEELDDLLDRHDLITEHRFGDYDGSPLSPASPRAIFIGRRR
jgi:SAM-dependent methyltransferase